MNRLKQFFGGRTVALVALLLLLATILSGCGGCGGGTKLTAAEIKEESIVAAKNQLGGDGAENAALSATQLNSIAQMLAATYSANLNTRQLLLAAYRGYNMLAEGFEDKAEYATQTGPDDPATTAVAVIKKANDTAKDANKITFDFSGLNKTDLLTLVNAFKVNVDLTTKTGFIDGILLGIGKFLHALTKTIGFGSYIVGICVFAIIIEVLMLPFAIKQQKNSIRQAKLRPKEAAIRAKYKNRNDQASVQKMQQEIQEFYQQEQFSPYSGCLQLFLQLPIIMALYSIVVDPLHYVLGQASGLSSAFSTYFTTARAAGGFGGVLKSGSGTIEVLSALREGGESVISGIKDFLLFGNGEDVFNKLSGIQGDIPNFNIGGVNFGLNPDFNNFGWLLLVPVLTFVVYFFSSKITRKLMNSQPPANSQIEARQQACSNTMMDIMMPAMSTYFTFVVPAIVGVYWIFRCLLNMLKQFIMTKIMPLPVFTEEDYKAAAREMAGKRPVKKSANVGKVRSLHHIDDEDFDDTREKALARKAAIEEREREEQAQKAKNTPFAAAPIKKDDKNEKKEKTEGTSAVEATEADENASEDTPQNNNKD